MVCGSEVQMLVTLKIRLSEPNESLESADQEHTEAVQKPTEHLMNANLYSGF